MWGGAVCICAIGVWLSGFLLVCVCKNGFRHFECENVGFCARLCRRRAAFGTMWGVAILKQFVRLL